MRNYFAYILLFAIGLQLSSSLLTVAAYEMNRDYITKNFCVNKNKPSSHCNGKCHLMKELQKEEKKNDSPINSLKDKNEVCQLFESSINELTLFPISLEGKSFSYHEKKSDLFTTYIFHPPLT